MNVKKFLSLLLSAVLIIGVLSATAFAGEDLTGGGVFEEEDDPYREEEEIPIVMPTLTASPSTISEGAVNPSISISSSVPFREWFSDDFLHVETGSTGLTLSGVDFGGNLVLTFDGTASAGTISGVLLGGAFQSETAAAAAFSIPVEPVRDNEKDEKGVCIVLLAANNGIDNNVYTEALIGHESILPDCMFTVPDGKLFSGWSINDQVYRPGDRYVFHGDTAVVAVWQDTETDWQKKLREVIRLIEEYIKKMTPEEKNDPDAIDLAVLYAETVCAQAASKVVSSRNIELSRDSLADLSKFAEEACAAAETTLINGGVTPARELFRTVMVEYGDCDINIHLAENITQMGVDKMSVKTPSFNLSFKAADIKEDLGKGMNITAKNLGTSTAPKVMVALPNGATTNSVTLSLPSTGKGTENHVIQSEDKKTVVSKRNPFTNQVEGKINSSGTYSQQTSQKDFSDISKKSAEMQSAIRSLATAGIIDGTTKTTFSPDASISRAEIAKLLVISLGKLNPKATASFTDVTRENWYYSAAASSQKHGLIKGFDDNTFRGTKTINKVQIVAVASRVLTTEMKYKTPSDISSYLSKYSDGVAKWAQAEVALATKEKLVVYRADGTFSGDKNMTRGDAAIIIYRLFQRIW